MDYRSLVADLIGLRNTLMGGKQPLLPASPIARPVTPRGGPPGLIEHGNIDLNHRPVVQNKDGSYSTVRSVSFNMDGHEILVPTVTPDGRVVSDQDALALFQRTGQHLGIFDTPENANAYAESLHNQQARQYAPPPQFAPSPVAQPVPMPQRYDDTHIYGGRFR